MATGPMQFGADNDAGSPLSPPFSPNTPTQTILRSRNRAQATLVVRNEDTPQSLTRPGVLAGNGVEVVGGPVGVLATGGLGNGGYYGAGVRGVANPDGWGVDGIGNVAGVRGTSDRAGVLGESSGPAGGVGVWGRHLAGGYGVFAAGGGLSGTYPPAFYAENTARPRVGPAGSMAMSG
jgi:hypothetical protein